jgi:hypothetical protein
MQNQLGRDAGRPCAATVVVKTRTLPRHGVTVRPPAVCLCLWALLLVAIRPASAQVPGDVPFSATTLVSFGSPFNPEGSPVSSFTSYAGTPELLHTDGWVQWSNGSATNYSPTPNLYKMTNIGVSTWAGYDFALSRLTYFNAETWSGSNWHGIGVNITMDFLDSQMPSAPATVTFQFNFDLDITLNSPGQVPDILTFVNATPTQQFTYLDRRYTLALVGFRDPSSGNITNSFTLPENATVMSDLMARFTELGNNTRLTAPANLDFGRRMQGQTPTLNFDINKVGSDGTAFAAAANSDGISVNPVTGDLLGGNRTQTLTVGLNANDHGSATLGPKSYTITIDNLAQSSDGAGLGSDDADDLVAVSATVLQDRTITDDAVALGRVMVGRNTSKATTLRTTGDDDHNTRVTVHSATLASAPAQIAIGSTKLFDDPTDTLSASVSATFTTSGAKSGSLTLTDTNGVLEGEHLTGESVKPVVVNYTATAVTNRQLNATPVDLGRVMVGQTASGVTTLTTTGDDSDFTRVKVAKGTYGSGPTVQIVPTLTTFNSPSVTLNGSLQANFTTTGAKTGSITLSSANGALRAEGLTGEVVQPVAVGYTAQALANRQLTATPIAFGNVLAGGPVLAGSTQITTAGNDDAFTRVTLKQGSYTDGQATLSVAADHLFNSAAATASASATGQFTTAGSRSGNITLSSANGGLGGEGLTSESVLPLNVGWSANVYDRGRASFSSSSVQTSLSLDFGTLNSGQSSTQSFSIWNLIQTMDFTAGLKFNGISASTGNTNMFNLSMPAVGTSLAAGGHTSGGATFTPTGSGGSSYAASYTLSFIDDLTGIAGSAATQSLTLNLTGALGQTGPQPDPPYIINPSFEDIRLQSTSVNQSPLPDGSKTLGAATTRVDSSTGPSRWVAAWFSQTGLERDGNAGVMNPVQDMFTDPLPDGDHIAYITASAGLTDPLIQRAFGALASGWEYELSFNVGSGLGTTFTNPILDVLVLSGSDLIKIDPIASIQPVPEVGNWELWKQNYLLPEGSAYAGLPVYIRLGADSAVTGGTVFLDDIYFGFPQDDTGIIGDYNNNGQLDAEDIDLLFVEMNRSPNTVPPVDAKFDLTGDDLATYDDVIFWVESLKDTFIGDINLDGKVDGLDLNELALNWLNTSTTWGTGDLNGDAITNGLDLNLIALNWLNGVTAPQGLSFAAAWTQAWDNHVPEPGTSLLLLTLTTTLLRRRGRRVC